MPGRIYLLNDNSSLIAMEEAAYDSEGLLQGLLAEHPDLLAGDQINAEQPRRWMLVAREMAVPGEEQGSPRWSLDHLFLDQEAIPTLVEVKRSSDTRIRREVVGQLLDYAANAVAYWPVEEVKAKWEARCQAEGEGAEETLANFLEANQEPAEFWQQVKTNLQAGRVRLVFVADVIPAELRRVVEFLNEQMDPAEVLAVEVKQFVGEGVKTLVPRVFGQTETARKKKVSTSAPREKITEAEYLAAIDADHGPAERRVFRRIIAWSREHGLEDNFSTGGKGMSFIPVLRVGVQTIYPFSLQRKGQLVLLMRWLKDRPTFNDPAKREHLENMLRGVPGFRTGQVGMAGFPKILVASLTDDRWLETTIGALEWMVRELTRVDANG